MKGVLFLVMKCFVCVCYIAFSNGFVLVVFQSGWRGTLLFCFLVCFILPTVKADCDL